MLLCVGYSMIWFVFSLISKPVPVPLGTEVCFDDWCTTVTKTERMPVAANSNTVIILVDVTMSNHARGIAQKPDEPRIHLVDDKETRTLGIQCGKVPFDARLKLNESLETTLAFKVSKNATGMYALIEEGPFIAGFVFPENRRYSR